MTIGTTSGHWSILSTISLMIGGCTTTPLNEDVDEHIEQTAQTDLTESPEVTQAVQPTTLPCASVVGVCSEIECINGVRTRVNYDAGTSCSGPGLCDGHGKCVANIVGNVYPSYYVLSVMYAPPGSSSVVDYGQGGSFGSTVNLTSSWSNAQSLTVSTQASFLGGATAGLSVTGQKTATDMSGRSYDVSATTQTIFSIDGFQDVINHDLDRIYLWLNPQVTITTNPVSGNTAQWALGMRSGATLSITYVNVLWLRDPSTMPSNVRTLLESAHIGPSAYAKIASVDPFANAATPVDATRFKYQFTIPYLPVAVAGQNPTSTQYSINSTNTSTSTSSSTTSYGVSITAEGGTDFLGFLSASLKVTNEMTWTHSQERTTTSGTTMSATANIMQPSYGYTGPLQLNVYLDTLFNTFLFSF